MTISVGLHPRRHAPGLLECRKLACAVCRGRAELVTVWRRANSGPRTRPLLFLLCTSCYIQTSETCFIFNKCSHLVWCCAEVVWMWCDGECCWLCIMLTGPGSRCQDAACLSVAAPHNEHRNEHNNSKTRKHIMQDNLDNSVKVFNIQWSCETHI